jgi:hypothetical protein
MLIAMTVLIYAPLGHGAIYKWVDKQGVTHFSDAPPEGGRYETVTQPRLSPADPDAQRQLDELLKSQKQTEEDQQQKKKDQMQDAKAEAARADSCREAKERLAILKSRPGSRIMITAPDGTQRRLTEEEYQDRLAETQKQVADFCQE